MQDTNSVKKNSSHERVFTKKVENACFQLKVRGSEIPKELLAEQLEGRGEEEQHTENPYD